MRIYLAGPMTGYPDLNYPAFAGATAFLRQLGHHVISPAELNPIDTEYGRAMRNDIRAVCDVDAIATLPGWEKSAGATTEFQIATCLELLHITLACSESKGETEWSVPCAAAQLKRASVIERDDNGK